MTRRAFPKSVKVAAFERASGNCEICTARLYPPRFHYDHILPDWLGGKPTLENCQCLCENCHRSKTSSQDVPRIAKAKRQRDKHIKARKYRKPMPGSRASGWRKRMDGTVERRE